MLVGGMRATYNEPDFTGIYYERLDKWALRTLNLQKTVKKVSGKKFRHAFREIEEHFHEDKLLFDYTMKDGPCKTTNAQFLLKLVGIN